jgi:tetratricopeptide (TPR) repeat protein
MAARRQIKFTIHRAPKAPAIDVSAALREGLALLQAGKLVKAKSVFHGVLAAEPGHFDALHLLGVIAARAGQPAEADKLISQALAIKPAEAAAYANRGLARQATASYEAALADFDRAIAIRPDYADACCNRANTLLSLGHHAEALAGYDRAIVINPRHVESHGNRGNALQHLGRYDEALACYNQALAIRPAYTLARANRSNLFLLTGRFVQGWQDYEARWEKWQTAADAQQTLTPSRFTQPLWNGDKSKGTLLIWPEQGIGDQILYAAMLDEARARVGRLILATDKRLQPLLARSFPDCEVTTIATALRQKRFDLQLPQGSLGMHFRNNIAAFLKHRKAFLKADPVRSAALRKTIAPTDKRICGLSWLSTNKQLGGHKSLALDTLRPLLEKPGLRFVDLQYGDTTAERAATARTTGTAIVHLDAIDNTKDIDQLAALIDACDFIVTISNTTAHLAGALGKEVFLMLPHAAGRLWYWQTDRDDTLCYPNVRVFRQRRHGDWTDVVDRVCAAIAKPSTKPRRR